MPDDAVVLHVLNTGWGPAPGWILMRGGGVARIRVPTMVALLRHPQEGWGLFDTGYAQRVYEETGHGVFRLYRLFVPTIMNPAGSAAAQLARFGLAPADIAWIVISHFHADHVGGLADFPSARFIASRSAYDDVRPRRGFRALRRAFVPSLLPADFGGRVTLVDDFGGPELAPFGPTHDLFGDGALLLCNLPGHARGQVGLHARTAAGPVLLAGDGCWLSRSYRENRPPHWITGAFVDDTAEARRTVAALHAFALTNPETAIVPAHCPEAHLRFVGRSDA